MKRKIKKRKSSSYTRALDLRVKVLTKELHDPYTKRLGPAAIKSVKETLDATRAERRRAKKAL